MTTNQKNIITNRTVSENSTQSGASLGAVTLLRIASHDRNQPCPCGSGRKVKKCCATADKWNAAKQDEREAREAAFKARAEERLKEESEGKPRRRSVMMPALRAMAALGATGGRRL